MVSVSSRWEHCPDGIALEYFEHSADRAASYQGVILIASALGVPARFYNAYANFMAMRGFTVLSFNYRGIGLSGQQGNPALIRLAQWGSQDLDTMIGQATKSAGNHPVYLVGHSIGGQVVGLAKRADQLSAVIFVGASFPYWSRGPLPYRLKLLSFYYCLVPIVGRLRDPFPARAVGLSNADMPSRLLRDWAEWASQKDYLLSPRFHLNANQAYSELCLPALAFEFADDLIAPAAAAQKLYDSYPSLQIEVRRKPAGKPVIGHMGFFRESVGRPFWEEQLAWMTNKQSAIAKQDNAVAYGS
ncbi:MAG: alpha/beta fold hydrolase [Alcanivorax sediminis]|uniref:alpha/beta hydrolase family protein n=1 Tax=Alcanivorax sediminis TaxID=2663008 RepID=UPI003C4DDEFD